jgi:hypothetical protein
MHGSMNIKGNFISNVAASMKIHDFSKLVNEITIITYLTLLWSVIL